MIWLIFLNISPQGIDVSRDSTIGRALSGAEPFNASYFLTSDSPSLMSGIIHGNLVMTPDAGASIGQINYVSNSMKNFEFPTWDPYMQSGRPMFPADGYNTGILDPFQFAFSFLPLDIVQKIALTSAVWTFIFIFFSLLSIRFFTTNPWAQVVGILLIFSGKAFHYIPNHLLTLGAYVSGAITCYLVLSLLNEKHQRNNILIATLLGFSLLNFSGFGLGISMVIFGCGLISLSIQFGFFSKRILNYLFHLALSVSIALPHILKVRQTQSSSTNSQLPYVSDRGSVSASLRRIEALFPSSTIIIFCIVGVIFLGFLVLVTKKKSQIIQESHLRNNPNLIFCFLMFSVPFLGLLGVFEPLGLYIGFNVQANNIYPLPFALSLAALSALSLDFLNKYLLNSKKYQSIARFSLPFLLLALFVSPFNALQKWNIEDMFFIALAMGIVWTFNLFKENIFRNSFLIYVISIWIFVVPVAHQFYGLSFSVQDHNQTIRKQICAEISCSSSYRFVALHSTDSAGIPGLSYENANSFLYYPTTSSLYGFYEATGGLSLNSIDYADLIASVNSNLFQDNPEHTGSMQFISKVQKKVLHREMLDYRTAVEVQNRRNNYLVWNPDSSLLRYLSVRYLISEESLPKSASYDLVHKFTGLRNLGREMTYKLRSPAYYVYEIKNPIPRVSFPSRVSLRGRDGAQILKDLSLASNFNLAIIDSDAKNSRTIEVEASGTILSQEVSVNSINIDTRQDSSQYLLINESYHPGWTAQVNGKEVNIKRANSVFMAVKLPKGQNHVELRFRIYDQRELYLFFLLPLLPLIGLRLSRLNRRESK
jgi:hypothetical protein